MQLPRPKFEAMVANTHDDDAAADKATESVTESAGKVTSITVERMAEIQSGTMHT